MAREMITRPIEWRGPILLAVGAIVGVLMAAIGAIAPNGRNVGALPEDAIARVNDKTIGTEEFARAMTLLAGDKRYPVTDEDRGHVLDRLIDEELLVQDGIETGLVDSDRTVRKAISTAMIASIIAESASNQPSEDDLRAFYQENRPNFARIARQHYPTAGAGQVVSEGEKIEPPAFEDIREQVEAIYIQRARDKALRDYLEWLRGEVEITLAQEPLR